MGEDGGTAPPDASPEAPVGDFTLGGALRVGKTLFIDSDNADPNNALAGNDDAATSQDIGNPSTVGGFLGVPRTFDDPVDVYLVDLAPGQIVTLFIGDPGDGSLIPDFDLRLSDGAGTLVDESLGTGAVELVEVPAAAGGGSEPFFIQV
jgi:hypothetical protein